VHTDLPWWQVGPLALLGCLIAVGLLAGVNKLLTRSNRRRATPPPPPRPPGGSSAAGEERADRTPPS